MIKIMIYDKMRELKKQLIDKKIRELIDDKMKNI